MEKGPEKTGNGDALMKVRKECKKWPPWDVQKAQSANFQQLAKQSMKETEVSGDYSGKCKSKLSTDSSKWGISTAFLYQCGQSWKPVAYMSHTPTKTECQHVQIEKAALALVHKCKISHLYLWEDSVNWTDHKTYKHCQKGPGNLSCCTVHISFLGTRLQF